MSLYVYFAKWLLSIDHKRVESETNTLDTEIRINVHNSKGWIRTKRMRLMVFVVEHLPREIKTEVEKNSDRAALAKFHWSHTSPPN